MVRIILRELLILVGSLAVFPAVMLVALVQSESPEASMKLIARAILSTQLVSSSGTLMVLGVRMFAPYLLVQAVRAYFWSGHSLKARRWANFYYMILLASVGVWCFLRAWDLFHLMYALGDMPGELQQFLEMEGRNVAIMVACAAVGVHCLRVFLDPAKGWRPRDKKT